MIALFALVLTQNPVLELEHPAARSPDDGTFAHAYPARWASGRECVVAFHGEGRASWSLQLEQPWEGTLWLRYAARSEVRLPFGWGPLEKAELSVTLLPSTGAVSGKHAWSWAPLARATLGSGQHSFTLGAAPLRLDCVLLGSATPPTHLDAAPVAPLTEDEALALARPASPSSPAWLEPFAGLAPPLWYDRTRLCLHTRLGPPWVQRPRFEQAAEGFASLGARSFVRHVRTRGEGLWWPSESGVSAPWASAQLVPGMVTRAREHGLRLVAYFRHLEDVDLAERHPDWRCRDDLGRPLRGRNGDPRVCLNSPFLDHLEAQLLELAQLGVDGVYFDEDHWPRDGCWCPSCKAGFKVLCDLDLPPRMDLEDPRYRRLLEFGALSMERAFRRLRRALKQRAPELAILIGSNRAPDPMEHFASDRLWRLADGVKTEYGKGHGTALREYLRQNPGLDAPARDVWLALGWAYSRDAAEGRPPHIWCNAISEARAARAAAAAVIVHGGIANLDCKEAAIPGRETFGPAVALGNRLSDALAGARPARWGAVHWPGRLYEHVLGPEERYERIAGPLGQAFEVLLRARRPAGVLTDSLLAEGALAGYRVLLLPALRALDEQQRRAVADFREGGGQVIEFDEGWDLEKLMEVPSPSWSVEGGPARMHVVAHRSPEGRLLLALTNDPGWVYTEQRVTRAGRPTLLPRGVDVVPEACEGVLVRLPPGTSRVLEVVSGTELEVTGGAVHVPAFAEAALLRLE